MAEERLPQEPDRAWKSDGLGWTGGVAQRRWRETREATRRQVMGARRLR